MARVADLLLKRERRGLRSAIVARIVVFLLSTAVVIAAYGSVFELVFSVAVFLAAAACAAFLLRSLKPVSNPVPIGLAAAGIDVALLAVLPLIWLTSVGGPEVMPLSFTLKGGLVPVALTMIVLNGLPLRPLYPLVASLGSAAVYLGYVAAALLDSRTEITGDYAKSLMGPPLQLGGILAEFAIIVIVGGMVVLTTLLARRLMLSGVQLERANAQLGRYFSPAVRDEISDASDTFFKPGGAEQVVTVLFSDIRNFTAMSETMSPQEVVALLSEYHSRMVDAVFAHGGTLDKFIGDALMATFGTPRPAADDVDRAVQAGIAMRSALDAYNKERERRGQAALRHGVGIHSGKAVVGNVGTPDRLEYTVIGDTVNVASRIAAACKATGEDLLISKEVRTQLTGSFAFRKIDPIALAGKSEKVDLFAVETG